MTRSYVALISFLAAVWGASYLFIKVAVEEIEPAPMVAFRLLVAAAILLAYVVVQMGRERAVAELRASWRDGLFLGTLNAAIPFWLVAWGEKHIDSGIAAIAQASVPIFVVLIGLRFLPGERLAGGQLAGVVLGLVGVGVLAGAEPEGGWWGVAGTLAVVASSLAYASGSIYGQRRVSSVPGPVLAAGSMAFAGLLALPFGLLQVPDELPSWKATGSVAALTLLGTAAAQLVLFRALRLHGSAKVSLVTYLMPPVALFYGALLLDEPLTAGALGGLALILLGVALGSGAVRLPRRAPVTQTP